MFQNSKLLSVYITAFCIMGGISFSLLARSWQPLVFFSLVVIITSFVPATIEDSVLVLSGKRPWSNFSTTNIAVSISAIAFVIVGIMSFVERMVWFNTESAPPSFMVAKEYGERYTANKHRLFKFSCDARADKGPIYLRDDGENVYARCGEWYPQVYTISVNSKVFYKVQEETANDPPGMAAIIEKDD